LAASLFEMIGSLTSKPSSRIPATTKNRVKRITAKTLRN
jgi:hypothetical protein